MIPGKSRRAAATQDQGRAPDGGGSVPRDRYLAAHADDEEPSYFVRDAMTAKDVAFNVKRLRQEGKTKLGRADALEAWWEIQKGSEAPPAAA